MSKLEFTKDNQLSLMFLQFTRCQITVIPKRLFKLFWGAGLLFGILYFLSYSKVSRITELSPSGDAQQRILPVLQPSGAAGEYQYEMQIEMGLLSPGIIHFVPDDRVSQITVNGAPINLEDYLISGNVGDIYSGFYLDLSALLSAGENTIIASVWDIGGDGGLYGLHASVNLIPASIAIAILIFFFSFPLIHLLVRSSGISLYRFYGATLVVMGCGVQFYQIIKYNPLSHVWSDPARHWIQGIEAIRLDPMALTDPVAYQIYIGILAKLSLNVPELVAYYTLLLALVGKWFWYKFFRELQPNKTVAIYGWAAISLLPSWIGIYSYFMQETLLIATLGLALVSTWRARRKKTLNVFLVMVLCWIAAGLTRGIAIPMAAVACTWVWVAQDQKIRKSIASCVVLCMVMVPLALRSESFLNFWAPHGVGALSSVYARSGNRDIHVIYHRQGAIWEYGFVCPSMGLMPFAPFSDWTSRRSGVVKVDVNIDAGYADWATALRENPLSIKKYLWITLENVAYIFWGPSWPDTNPAHMVEAINYIFRWFWAPATIIMLLASVFLFRREKKDWLLFGIILSWYLVQVIIPISVNEGRYRKPYEGLLLAQYVYLAGLFAAAQARRDKIVHSEEHQGAEAVQYESIR